MEFYVSEYLVWFHCFFALATCLSGLTCLIMNWKSMDSKFMSILVIGLASIWPFGNILATWFFISEIISDIRFIREK